MLRKWVSRAPTSVMREYAEKPYRRLGRNSAILMYHRVAEESQDPWDLCVNPEQFGEQLSILSQTANCVPLTRIQRDSLGKGKGKPTVAITFDDGYRDNLHNALPLLEQFGVPATVFVVADTLGTEREFWWDALERCILWPIAVPDRLGLVIGGKSREWTLTSRAAALPPERWWRVAHDPPPTVRQGVFLDLWHALVNLEDKEREQVLAQIFEWAKVSSVAPKSRTPLTRDELQTLAKHPLIEIGAHTKSHGSLPQLSDAQQWVEIQGSKRDLEATIGKAVTSFSYPFGRFDRRVIDVVRRAGYEVACTSEDTTVTGISNRLTLPRLQATGQSGTQFGRWLRSRLPRMQAA